MAYVNLYRLNCINFDGDKGNWIHMMWHGIFFVIEVNKAGNCSESNSLLTIGGEEQQAMTNMFQENMKNVAYIFPKRKRKSVILAVSLLEWRTQDRIHSKALNTLNWTSDTGGYQTEELVTTKTSKICSGMTDHSRSWLAFQGSLLSGRLEINSSACDHNENQKWIRRFRA